MLRTYDVLRNYPLSIIDECFSTKACGSDVTRFQLATGIAMISTVFSLDCLKSYKQVNNEKWPLPSSFFDCYVFLCVAGLDSANTAVLQKYQICAKNAQKGIAQLLFSIKETRF